MRRKRYSEEQSISSLKEHEQSGAPQRTNIAGRSHRGEQRPAAAPVAHQPSQRKHPNAAALLAPGLQANDVRKR